MLRHNGHIRNKIERKWTLTKYLIKIDLNENETKDGIVSHLTTHIPKPHRWYRGKRNCMQIHCSINSYL